ncbi:MAG: hypothetical protein LC746_09215 [Acidobacteria bacterium]|nr:hypothetical protein [Acidobacteriota bacterium]
MSARKSLSCCAAFLLLNVASVTSAQQKSQRNLKAYDDGGSYELTWASRPDELESIKERFRAFIWDHWERKRAGYITIRVCTEYYEGCDDSTFYAFYVEPDQKGGWQLSKEAGHYISAELNGGKEFRGSTDPVIFTNVEKVRPEEAETCYSFFSSLVETKSHTFLLRFIYDKSKKDLSGNCIIF